MLAEAGDPGSLTLEQLAEMNRAEFERFGWLIKAAHIKAASLTLRVANMHHPLPHRPARHAEFEASIGVAQGEVLVDELPGKQLRLVQAWIELHRDELAVDWELMVNGEPPRKIEPLRGVTCPGM